MPNVFFDNRFLDGKSHKEYVAFVDIMGTRTHMKAGVDEAANFIFKLHAAIISACAKRIMVEYLFTLLWMVHILRRKAKGYD